MHDGALRIGVDLGGTKIEGVVLSTGEGEVVVHARRRVSTLAEEGYEAVVARVASLVRDIAREASLPSLPPVGIGLPGSVSRQTGFVKNANTQCLNGRPFRHDLSAALGTRIAFENDANCLVLAEARLGAARQYEGGVVFGIILGTGVGGGLVLRGALHAGAHGIAGEWGHHTLREGGRACYCGRSGCVETYLSGAGLSQSYAEMGGDVASAADIAARADSGEVIAERALGAYLEDFGRALGNVVNILDPDAIVVGGGLSKLSALYDRGREAVRRSTFNDELTVPLLPAELGDAAGVFGAALLSPA